MAAGIPALTCSLESEFSHYYFRSPSEEHGPCRCIPSHQIQSYEIAQAILGNGDTELSFTEVPGRALEGPIRAKLIESEHSSSAPGPFRREEKYYPEMKFGTWQRDAAFDLEGYYGGYGGAVVNRFTPHLDIRGVGTSLHNAMAGDGTAPLHIGKESTEEFAEFTEAILKDLYFAHTRIDEPGIGRDIIELTYLVAFKILLKNPETTPPQTVAAAASSADLEGARGSGVLYPAARDMAEAAAPVIVVSGGGGDGSAIASASATVGPIDQLPPGTGDAVASDIAAPDDVLVELAATEGEDPPSSD